jgi:signal transduction histidine kinase
MKKMFFILSVLLFFLVKTNAQFYNIDSLKQRLNYAREDTNKLFLLLRISHSYTWSYADTSIIYAQQALDLAQKLNYERGLVWAQGQMSSALTTLGNYPLALEYGFKVLEWTEKHGSIGRISYANINIAMCYREQGDYNRSLVYCRKSLAMSDTIKSANFDHASIWGIVGSVYEKNNQPDSAIMYAKKTYELHNDWSGNLSVLGSAYSKKNNYDSAIFYYRAGLPVAVQHHTEIDLIDIYNGIAILKKAQGDIDSAAWYAKKALAEKVGKTYPLGLLQSANLLVDFYQSQNKADSTLKYLRTSISLKDSLFNRERTIAIHNLAFKEQEKQKEIEASRLKYQNRLKMYALLGGLVALLVIAVILLRNNRNKQKAFTLLQKQKKQIDLQKIKVEQTLDELKNTQSQLIQSEKMASLGELTAGIAHEIQNPLNFVNNFSEVNKELLTEMKDNLDTGNLEEAKAIAKDVLENEDKIIHHGKRADSIVKGMLQHSRASSGQKEATDINVMADECLRLAYHGLRAKDKSFNAKMKTDLDQSIGKINIVPQDIGRVLLNLFTNAFYSVTEKDKNHPDNYEPTVSVSTRKLKDKVEIDVKDNGMGIPKKLMDKIFQPFFTTKPTGQGTGLGLSLSYDIITKAHGGELKVETKEGEFAEFIIILPADN